jgi:hypothetical protein
MSFSKIVALTRTGQSSIAIPAQMDLLANPVEPDTVQPVSTPALPIAVVAPSKFKGTQEQSLILDAPLDGITVVMAYAGCGKTTSLVQKASCHPNKKGLYVAFNKGIQLEAQRKFPRSVQCSTSHSIAFRQVGRKYQHKLSADLRLNSVIQLLGLTMDYPMAAMIKSTILGYCVSDLIEFPRLAIAPDHEVTGHVARLQYAASQAAQLWAMMCDPSHPAPMIHDGYLKLFQLSGASLGVDYILFDEAQDANPVTTAIIRQQKCPVVLVGDRYQSIYAFRGASNALQTFKADRVLRLTNSFRFGPGVADIATNLLATFFDEVVPVVGKGFDTTVGRVDRNAHQFTTICRTNAEVFDQAVKAIKANESIGFIGGAKSYGFDKILDAYHLSTGDSHAVRDTFIRSMSSFAAYEMYAEDANDPEAKRHCKIVHTYGHEIPALVANLFDYSLPDVHSAKRGFTTAHKAKGFDLDHVVLADDFYDLMENFSPILDRLKLPVQEVNLTYVSVTRAVKTLEVNSQVRALSDHLLF